MTIDYDDLDAKERRANSLIHEKSPYLMSGRDYKRETLKTRIEDLKVTAE